MLRKSDRKWPLYLVFVFGILVVLYVLVEAVPRALDGSGKEIAAVICVLLGLPFVIAGIVFVHRGYRDEENDDDSK